jgi:hypothetical protein
VQDLEGDLGLVLGVDVEFAEGFAEMSERGEGRAAGILIEISVYICLYTAME